MKQTRLSVLGRAGEEITWAVIETGIQGDHPHFAKHKNIDLASPYHQDFTLWLEGPLTADNDAIPDPDAAQGNALSDKRGHGTHVAGIIAGEQERTANTPDLQMHAVMQELGSDMKSAFKQVPLDRSCGNAPKR